MAKRKPKEKRKPDRIDRAAAKIAAVILADGERISNAKAIAALVRREVRRAVKEEHASLHTEIARIKTNLSGDRNATLVDQWRQCLDRITGWLDARESR